MSGHHATVDWTLDDGDFAKRRYSRVHTLTFDKGLVVEGSPAVSVVPLPYSKEGALDPESAFVGALSACHMLTFLDLAARAGFTVTAYRDEAEGSLGKGADGRMQMTRVVLRPQINFTGQTQPTPEQLADLHHRSHELCFIANSVKTPIDVEPVTPN